VNNNWIRCKDDNIVYIWPRLSGSRNGSQWKEFCRIKVFLHIPHRCITQLNKNNLPWSTLYQQHIDTINKDLRDLLSEPVDNEEQLSNNESEYELPEDEEHEKFRYD
jgi:hypothetical protein